MIQGRPTKNPSTTTTTTRPTTTTLRNNRPTTSTKFISTMKPTTKKNSIYIPPCEELNEAVFLGFYFSYFCLYLTVVVDKQKVLETFYTSFLMI